MVLRVVQFATAMSLLAVIAFQQAEMEQLNIIVKKSNNSTERVHAKYGQHLKKLYKSHAEARSLAATALRRAERSLGYHAIAAANIEQAILYIEKIIYHATAGETEEVRRLKSLAEIYRKNLRNERVALRLEQKALIKKLKELGYGSTKKKKKGK